MKHTLALNVVQVFGFATGFSTKQLTCQLLPMSGLFLLDVYALAPHCLISGPLTVELNGKVVLVGISSYGTDCYGDPNPMIFARLSKVVEWIFYQTDAKKYQCY